MSDRTPGWGRRNATSRVPPAGIEPATYGLGNVVQPSFAPVKRRGGKLGASSRALRRCRNKLLQENANAIVDLVSNWPDLLKRLSRWIRQVPVEVALARIDRAGIPATHRDDGIRVAHDLIAERLGELLRDVDPDLRHGLNDGGVDLLGGRAPRGTDV